MDLSSWLTTILPHQYQQQNVFAAIVTIVYVKVVVFVADQVLVRYNIVSSRISRKFIHVCAGSWIMFWPFFVVVDDEDGNDSDGASSGWWKLNIIVPAIYSVQLLYKGLFLPSPPKTTTSSSGVVVVVDDPDVRSMTRTGNPRELLNGPLMFTLTMCVVGIYCFRTQLGVVIMSMLTYGDGIAPLIGYYYPYGRYRTFPFITSEEEDNGNNGKKDKRNNTNNNSNQNSGSYKTLSGSFGFWCASIVGYYLLASIALATPYETNHNNNNSSDNGNNNDHDYLPLPIIVQIATTCTIAESLSGSFDNVAVAITAAVTYHYLT